MSKQLSLVWRPLEILANRLGFRIEVVTLDYLPSCINFSEATFIGGRVRVWSFECFHVDMNAVPHDSCRRLGPKDGDTSAESHGRTLCRYWVQLSASRSEVIQTSDDPASNNSLSDRGRDICDNRHNRIEVHKHEDSRNNIDKEGDSKIGQSVSEDEFNKSRTISGRIEKLVSRQHQDEQVEPH